MEYDVNKIREDFPMFKNYPTMQGKKLVYFDNAATTFKPYQVIQAQDEYYLNFTANSHRGDYDLAHLVDVKYDEAREEVAKFINANKGEVVFTSGASMSLNLAAFGLMDFLKQGDEILIPEAEHASNILPWFHIAHVKKCNVRYIPLSKDGHLTIENFEKSLTPRTKIVSLAQVTNVLGHTIPVKEFANLAHKNGSYFIVDGAQSVPHMKIDVKDMDCDLLAFSGHKLCGPTGIGVLYGKYDLLVKMPPLLTGGGMNTRFETCGNVTYQIPPLKFEAGTQNIAGALGLASACKYLEKIGLDKIEKHELELRQYIINALEKNDNIVLYNKNAESGIITFNFKNVFAQDGASLLNSKGIAVRSGQHCAKILLDFLHTDATIRASLYLYNTKEEADQFIEACTHGKDFLDAFFN